MEVAPLEKPPQAEGQSDEVYNLECALATEKKFVKLEKKIDRLTSVLDKDLKAADFKWSLFVAASKSFRYDSRLKPFPPMFIKNGNKDIDELSNFICDTTPLDLLPQQLRDNVNIDPKLVDLLFYVLVNLREPYLRSIPSEFHETILKKVPCSSTAPKPQHIFQVVSTVKSNAENKWRELAHDRETLFAYHGSHLENFYSILHYGLQQHLNKNFVFGSGTYLSSELSVSLLYSPGSFGWGASVLGANLSCVAMCELINKVDDINCQKSTLMEARGDSRPDGIEANLQASDSLAGEVPHKYYLVTNNDLIRVRYLLVYAKQPPMFGINSSISNERAGSLRRWFGRHKFFSILLGYGLMLATIGFANNQPIQYYYRMFLRKVDIAFKGINFKPSY